MPIPTVVLIELFLFKLVELGRGDGRRGGRSSLQPWANVVILWGGGKEMWFEYVSKNGRSFLRRIRLPTILSFLWHALSLLYT